MISYKKSILCYQLMKDSVVCSRRRRGEVFMEKVKVFEVKVLISKSEHMNKKKIVAAESGV